MAERNDAAVMPRWPEPRTSHDLEGSADPGHRDRSSRDTSMPKEPEGDTATCERRRCTGMDNQPRYRRRCRGPARQRSRKERSPRGTPSTKLRRPTMNAGGGAGPWPRGKAALAGGKVKGIRAQSKLPVGVLPKQPPHGTTSGGATQLKEPGQSLHTVTLSSICPCY